ncbi:unnamed protein product [Gordionus sp. m RMFG-2023]
MSRLTTLIATITTTTIDTTIAGTTSMAIATTIIVTIIKALIDGMTAIEAITEPTIPVVVNTDTTLINGFSKYLSS